MRRPEQFLIAVATFAVVHAAWGLSGLPQCGEADAPQCNGECPSGTRCTQVEVQEAALVRVTFDETAREPQPGLGGEEPGCACLEVPCGGVPLEDGQACCNGTVTNASDECGCLREGLHSLFYACCEKTEMNGSIEDRQLSLYTYNLPLDCCEGTTCGGTCVGAECAASDCCVCEPFPGVDATPACAAADSDPGCWAACFFSPEGVGLFPVPELGIGNQSGVRIENGVCGEEGCIPPTAPAPATSSTGLAVSIACLAAIGMLALVRRRTRQD